MRIDELTMPGLAPPATGTAPTPQDAQKGISPQQQLAQVKKEKMARKKQINDQIAMMMKQIADLRKQLMDIGR
jgi:TolA-binding protein